MSAQANRVVMSTTRRSLLAKVAIARKDLGLTEEDYRARLERIAGQPSARRASDAQLARLVQEFRSLGWKPSGKRLVTRTVSPHADIRMVAGLWQELGPYLRDGSAEALRTFVQRMTKSRRSPAGVSAPEFMDSDQTRKVIEALKDWLGREVQKAAKPDQTGAAC